MKFQLPLLLLAALAECAPTENVAQAATTYSNAEIGFETPKMVTPKYRSTAKRAIIRYPAFTLRGKKDSSGQTGILKAGAGMCSKCTLLSAHYRLVNDAGVEATFAETGVYIHHMISFLTPKQSSSPIGGGGVLGGNIGSGAYFIDRGEDSGETDTVFTSADGKFASGYQIPGTPSITISYQIVNYKDAAKQLHLELEYEYLDGIVGQDAGHTLKSVAGNPKTMGKSVSTAMAISKDTTIVWARGHLHDGGVSMTLKVNGVQRCISNATYNDKTGQIAAMSLCPEPIKLKAGDSMSIESLYDTTKHKLRESTDGSGAVAHGALGSSDVMGMFAMSYTT